MRNVHILPDISMKTEQIIGLCEKQNISRYQLAGCCGYVSGISLALMRERILFEYDIKKRCQRRRSIVCVVKNTKFDR